MPSAFSEDLSAVETNNMEISELLWFWLSNTSATKKDSFLGGGRRCLAVDLGL